MYSLEITQRMKTEGEYRAMIPDGEKKNFLKLG